MGLILCQEGGRNRGSEMSLPGFLVNVHEAEKTRYLFKPGNGEIKRQLHFFSPKGKWKDGRLSITQVHSDFFLLERISCSVAIESGLERWSGG